MTRKKNVIIRHRKENLKKCSLRGLEGREDLTFYTYPFKELPNLDNYVLLDFEGPLLTEADRDKGLLLVDGTWRYAEKIVQALPSHLPRRSLPQDLKTAYPRRQKDCTEPSRGLASVEALYVAYVLMGLDSSGLLDHYHWKEAFLKGFYG